MGLRFTFRHESMWVTEGSEWRPPTTIILRDAAGAVIPSSQMATMLMTLYDTKTQAIVNGVDGTVDVKNVRSCVLSLQGVFTLTLLPADNIMLDPTRTYEERCALVQYQWPTVPTKSDALEVIYVVRNVAKR
jgi:hypothetical protein